MKILHVNEHNALCGGVEGYVSDVIALLQRAGHENRLIYHQVSTGDVLDSQACYVPYRPLEGSVKSAQKEIARLLKQEKPDVALIHATYHPAIITAVALHTPAVMYIHSTHVVCPGDAQYLRRSQRICPRAAGPLCLLNAYVERCGWGRNPLHHIASLRRVQAILGILNHTLNHILVGSTYIKDLLIRNGVAAQKLRVLPPLFFNNVDKRPDSPLLVPPLLLYVGRMIPEKGVEQLLPALARIPGAWQFLFIGDGPSVSVCQRQIAATGLSERVRLTGWLPPNELQQLYQQASLLVMPSLQPESFGRVGPEIMAWGKPVVAYDAGGIRDWLRHGENGLLVNSGDIDGLVEAITQLLNNTARRTRMGACAQQYVQQRFTAATHLAELEACFVAAQAQFGTQQR